MWYKNFLRMNHPLHCYDYIVPLLLPSSFIFLLSCPKVEPYSNGRPIPYAASCIFCGERRLVYELLPSAHPLRYHALRISSHAGPLLPTGLLVSTGGGGR